MDINFRINPLTLTFKHTLDGTKDKCKNSINEQKYPRKTNAPIKKKLLKKRMINDMELIYCALPENSQCTCCQFFLLG